MAAVLLLFNACGGGGGSSVDPNVPVISNLRVTFTGASCNAGGGVTGRANVRAFDYTDADGDLRGGTLESSVTPDVGAPIVQSAPIPSPPVAITGTTSGTISVAFCSRFNSATQFTQVFTVVDASGKRSNTLQATIARPPGVPLEPRTSTGESGVDRMSNP
jgi:hypothetical protein